MQLQLQRYGNAANLTIRLYRWSQKQTKIIEEMPPKRQPTVHVHPGDGGPVQISQINCNDVIFGRGHSLNDNAGTININFKNRIEAAMPEYLISEKHEKKHVAARSRS